MSVCHFKGKENCFSFHFWLKSNLVFVLIKVCFFFAVLRMRFSQNSVAFVCLTFLNSQQCVWTRSESYFWHSLHLLVCSGLKLLYVESTSRALLEHLSKFLKNWCSKTFKRSIPFLEQRNKCLNKENIPGIYNIVIFGVNIFRQGEC